MEDCPHLCENCGLRFPTEVRLKNHAKNARKYCFRYSCSVCPLKFTSASKLESHACNQSRCGNSTENIEETDENIEKEIIENEETNNEVVAEYSKEEGTNYENEGDYQKEPPENGIEQDPEMDITEDNVSMLLDLTRDRDSKLIIDLSINEIQENISFPSDSDGNIYQLEMDKVSDNSFCDIDISSLVLNNL